MTNPYEPALTASSRQPAHTHPRRHVFAGWWLCIAGVLHLTAMNLLSGNRKLESLDWSAAILVVLGLLVLCRFPLAIVFTRLIGSFAIVGLVFASVLMFAGVGDGGELTYGNITVVDPTLWQAGALLISIGLTLLPPWYALQLVFADNQAVQRSGVEELSDD